MKNTEHNHQVALFEWAEYMHLVYPELEMLYAIPNGGLRNKIVAARLKAEGVKPGYPDIGLDVARGGFHGLRIELKRPGGNGKRRGSVTADQSRWLKALSDQGYMAVVCWGWESAKDTIVSYLKLGAK